MKANITKEGILEITPESANEAEKLDNWIEDNQHCFSYLLLEAFNIVTSFERKSKAKRKRV